MGSIKSKHVSAYAPFLIEMRYGNLWGWDKMERVKLGQSDWQVAPNEINQGKKKTQNLVMRRHTMLSPQNVFNQRNIKETQLFYTPKPASTPEVNLLCAECSFYVF